MITLGKQLVIDVHGCNCSSLSMKWDLGLIPQFLKSVANSVKYRIISLSLLFFVKVVRMTLQSYTYMTYMYLFLLLDVIGKRPHKLE